jgi:hypothetical protein
MKGVGILISMRGWKGGMRGRKEKIKLPINNLGNQQLNN